MTDLKDRRDHGFLIGVMTGTFVGAALAIWLAPRVVSVRNGLADAVVDGAHEVARKATAMKIARC